MFTLLAKDAFLRIFDYHVTLKLLWPREKLKTAELESLGFHLPNHCMHVL
jgi:hypothetical protein